MKKLLSMVSMPSIDFSHNLLLSAYTTAKSCASKCLLLMAAAFATSGYAAADEPKMKYVFATVAGNKISPVHETADTIIVLDVIAVPQNTASNPTLQLAAFKFVQSHMKELGLTKVDPNSVFIGGGCCGTGDIFYNLNQVNDQRKLHLQRLEKRLMPNLNWLKFVGIQRGNWLVESGTITDPKTGLTWTQSDNGSEINWNEASAYCKGKGSGWGLPSGDELVGLIDKSQSTPCGINNICHVTSNFRLSHVYFWGNFVHADGSGMRIDLRDGATLLHDRGDRSTTNSRALCVQRP